MSALIPRDAHPSPTFSGHETFPLRSSWLKKGYDKLHDDPALFSREDAYVRLGVGKNMAQSIRYWLRVTGVAVRDGQTGAMTITDLGRRLLDDDGWDPFLTSPLAWWLLHWQIAGTPDGAFTWYYTFNLLRGAEFTPPRLAEELLAYSREQGWKQPSLATLTRDITCMHQCYVRPRRSPAATTPDEPLLCPLLDVTVMQAVPGQLATYRLTSGAQPDVPDELLAYAIQQILAARQSQTISLQQLAYAAGSPGRVFCLDADSLLLRLYRLEQTTAGRLRFSDQAGIRQVAWHGDPPTAADLTLLAHGFAHEVAR